jgi:quinoprotein glucose dehydrogenase
MKVKTGVVVICLAAIGLSEAGLGAGKPAQTTRTVWDGVFTEEQAARGRELYNKECSTCHAADLSGVDEAPALSGGAFLSNWDGLTVGDLFERVRISMPPNSKGKLSRQQIADILSYVMSANSFPTGKTEMDTKTEVLKQVRIDATKPGG